MNHASQARAARQPHAAIADHFVTRWSPRAMSGDPLTDAEIAMLFEAARWAPSAFNSQPWRFVYARRDTPQWGPLFGLLGEKNQRWVKHGALLVVVLSTATDPTGKVLRTHTFDAGAAWENIALQASAMGLVIHGMQGFDYDRARSELQVPEQMTVEATFIVGRPGSVADLPEDLQEREKPSQRRPVAEFAFEGALPAVS